jgi:hypothetical protein
LREGCRLRVSENSVLRRIFAVRSDEVRGKTCKLHNEELNNLLITQYSSDDKIEKMRWEGQVALMGERRGVYSFLVGKPEGKRPLGKPRHKWYKIL